MGIDGFGGAACARVAGRCAAEVRVLQRLERALPEDGAMKQVEA